MSEENKQVVPLNPKDIIDNIETSFPSFVIEAINNVLKRNFRGNQVNISQDEILKEIVKLSPKRITKDKVFNNSWMDFEPLYRKYGWEVRYDGPGYNESYEPFYIFKPIK